MTEAPTANQNIFAMKKTVVRALLLAVSAVAWAQPEVPIEQWEGKTILLIGAHPDDDTYSMGTLAMRDNIDLTGAEMEVHFNVDMKGNFRYTSIDVTGRMPAGLSAEERIKLEKAAELCPIKHMFADEIPVNVEYRYPDQA